MTKFFDFIDASLVNVHYETGIGFCIKIECEYFGLITIEIGFPELYFHRRLENPSKVKPAGLYVSKRTELIKTVSELSYDLLPIDKCFHLTISIKDNLIDIVSTACPIIRSTRNACEMKKVLLELNDYLSCKSNSIEINEPCDNFLISFTKNITSYGDANIFKPISKSPSFPVYLETMNIDNDGVQICIISSNKKERFEMTNIISPQTVFFIEELTYTDVLRCLSEDYPDIGPIYTVCSNEVSANGVEATQQCVHLRIQAGDYIVDICGKDPTSLVETELLNKFPRD